MAEEIEVSKANIYSALGPATGIDASKANIYSVLGPSTGVSVSKSVMYTVLVEPDFWPAILRLLDQ